MMWVIRYRDGGTEKIRLRFRKECSPFFVGDNGEPLI